MVVELFITVRGVMLRRSKHADKGLYARHFEGLSVTPYFVSAPLKFPGFTAE